MVMNLPFEKILLDDAPLEIIDCKEDENHIKFDEILDEGYCLVLNWSNLTEKGFNFERIQFISKEKDESLINCKLNRGDVVLSIRNNRGWNMGNVAFYGDDVEFDNIRIDSGMVILRPKEKLLNQFLYYFIQSDCFKKQIGGHKYLALRDKNPPLPLPTLKKFEFYFPPLDQQKRIVEFFSQLDEKIDSRKKINENLKEQLNTIYNSFFEYYDGFSRDDLKESEIGLIPKHWDLVTLVEVTTEIKETVENNMELFSPDHGLDLILFDSRGRLKKTGIKNYIVVKQKEFAYNPYEINRKFNRPFDFYSNKTKREFIRINDFDFDGCVNPRYVVFKVEEGYENFMNMYFKSNTFNQAIRKLSSDLNIRKMYYDDFSMIKIAYPPKETVDNFNNIYETFQELIKCNESIISNLEKIKETLLPKLIAGEIDVSEINWDY